MITGISGRPSVAERSLAVLRTLFGQRFGRDFSIALWDGVRVEASARSLFTLRLNQPFAIRAALTPPLDLSPGRAFVENWIDVDGDLEAAIDFMEGAIERFPRRALPRLIAQLLRLPKAPTLPRDRAPLHGERHSRKRDAAAIGFHYDQPTTFYRAFLDSRLVYSCGYWDDGITSLDDAQLAKIDYTLRKVRLRSDERLLDIGCGWGALVIRAAQRFGAYALGITLSRRQYEEAQRQIRAAGVADRVRVELRDYRDLAGETFDKIVSVGMVEHVGRERLGLYFHNAYEALRTGGLFLNHGIAQQNEGDGYRVSGFMDRYVFPDGDLVSIGVALRAAEAAGFEIRDVENLREHYARTLRSWRTNLETNRGACIGATDERTFRIWQLYMTGSARNFSRGQMGLFQTVLAKSANAPAMVPATRRDLYR